MGKNKKGGCVVINSAANKVTFCHELNGCSKCEKNKGVIKQKITADEEAFIIGKAATPGHLCRINNRLGVAYPETIGILGTKNPRIVKMSVLLSGENQEVTSYGWGAINFIASGQKEYLEKLYLAEPKKHQCQNKPVF